MAKIKTWNQETWHNILPSWLYLPCILTVTNFIPIRGYSRRDVRVKATAQQRELWKHQIYWGDIGLLIYIHKIVTDICGKRHYLTRLNKQPSSPLVLYRQYQLFLPMSPMWLYVSHITPSLSFASLIKAYLFFLLRGKEKMKTLNYISHPSAISYLP